MNAYELAREDLGTWEWSKGHNPKVVQYFADAGHSWVKDDETAWCAAFVGAMLERSGETSTQKLNARSYSDWGEEVELEDAVEGDIAVFTRGDPNGWQGHVGFYVKHDDRYVWVLGGNQKNQVNISKYSRSRLLSIRRLPAWRPVVPPLDAPVPPSGWETHEEPKPSQGLFDVILNAILTLFRR